MNSKLKKMISMSLVATMMASQVFAVSNSNVDYIQAALIEENTVAVTSLEDSKATTLDPQILRLQVEQEQGRNIIKDADNTSNFTPNVKDYSLYMLESDTEKVIIKNIETLSKYKTATLTIDGVDVNRKTDNPLKFEDTTVYTTGKDTIDLKLTQDGKETDYTIKLIIESPQVFFDFTPAKGQTVSKITVYSNDADVLAAHVAIKLDDVYVGTGDTQPFKGFSDISGNVYKDATDENKDMVDGVDYSGLNTSEYKLHALTQTDKYMYMDLYTANSPKPVSGKRVHALTLYVANNENYKGTVEDMVNALSVPEKSEFSSFLSLEKYGDVYDVVDSTDDKKTPVFVDSTAKKENVRLFVDNSAGKDRVQIQLIGTGNDAIVNTENIYVVDGDASYGVYDGKYKVMIKADGYLTGTTEEFEVSGNTEDGIIFTPFNMLEGDLDADNKIDAADLNLLLGALNMEVDVNVGLGYVVVNGKKIHADYNDDNEINILDLGRMLKNNNKQYEAITKMQF